MIYDIICTILKYNVTRTLYIRMVPRHASGGGRGLPADGGADGRAFAGGSGGSGSNSSSSSSIVVIMMILIVIIGQPPPSPPSLLPSPRPPPRPEARIKHTRPHLYAY